MTSSIERPSAKVYHFPLQPRTRRTAQNKIGGHTAGIDPSSQVTAITGGSWYHEEAVRDAERAKKR